MHQGKVGWLALLAYFSTGLAWAQQQVVTGPKARYWVTAETTSGMSMAAMQSGGMLAMMGGQGPRKLLRLDLGAQRGANPAEGTHSIPPGLGMGASLPLFGERTANAPVEAERDIPETDRERPRGRLLFFWGCGETAGPGQPIVLDFAQMANGVLPPNLRSINIRAGRSNPGFGRDAGYADWPNRRPGGNTAVPTSASLLGEHSVTSNISPDIRFSVGAGHDYMDALSLQASRSPGGGQRLAWNSVATATGYFATAMGSKQAGGSDGGDMVMWNASSQRLLGGEQLMGFLAPAEVERLIRERVVLPPSTNECVISKEAVAAAGGDMVMVNLNAFGPELNVVHPPRPQDVRQPWHQDYAVKVRLRSSTGLLGGMEAAASRGNRGAQPPAPAEQGSGQAQTQPPVPGPGGVLPGAAEAAGQIFRGLFGR